MSRILPHPLLSLLLIIVWCLLINEITAGIVVLGVIFGLLIPILTAPFWPDAPKEFHSGHMAVYVVIVIWDILIANIQVAWVVLTRSNASMRSTFLVVPLRLRHPEAISVLAGTITLTPGTVSADLSSDGRALLVHALDSGDPDADVANIRYRYERRLLKVFA